MREEDNIPNSGTNTKKRNQDPGTKNSEQRTQNRELRTENSELRTNSPKCEKFYNNKCKNHAISKQPSRKLQIPASLSAQCLNYVFSNAFPVHSGAYNTAGITGAFAARKQFFDLWMLCSSGVTRYTNRRRRS